MADRDDNRGYGGGGFGRWRDEDRNRDNRQDDRGRGREDRSFDGGQGRFDSDQARYGQGSRSGPGYGEGETRRDRRDAGYDQDRTGYRGSQSQGQGRGYGGGWDRGQDTERFAGNRSQGGPGGYGGQEYGMEGRYQQNDDRYRNGQSGEGQQGRSGGNERERWRADGNAPYGDLELNARASGVEEFGAPHDYAYHPKQGHEFESDYVTWREQQLRQHDRDYGEWRKHQHEQYDNEYRKFRTERRDTFGKNFHEWRSQRNMSTGMSRQDIEPGGGDYAPGRGIGFGGGDSQPSGKLESRSALTPGPTLGQTASSGGGGGGGGGGEQALNADFSTNPSRVQAITDGGDGHRDHEARTDGENRTDKDRDS